MTKRVPSRNARSKGIKLKHVLQMCLLLCVSFWLIYQVKHSHDKKKELNEKDARISSRSQSGDEMLNFGRKDLHPRVPELVKNENHGEDEREENEEQEEINKKDKLRHEQDQEEDDEEEIVHEEESKKDDAIKEDDKKHEKEEQEEDTKDDETEDEGRQGGDDGIDEHDREKMEGDANGEEDFIEEETEREENGDEKKTENNEDEDKELQLDHDPSLEDGVNEGNAHEAREEHYKADDASSAVAHDSSITSTEPDKLGADTSNEKSRQSDLEKGNKSNNISEAQEEHYKADDASSAVTQKSVANSSELEWTSFNKSNENLATDGLVQENKLDGKNTLNVTGVQTNTTSESKQGVTVEYVPSGENKDVEISLPNPQNKSPEVASVSSDQQQTSNKSTEATGGDNSNDGSAGASGSSQQSEISKSTEAENGTVDGVTTEEAASQKTIELEHSNNNTESNSSQLQYNSTINNNTKHIEANSDGSSNSSSNLDSSDKTIKPDAAADADTNSESSIQIKQVTHAASEVKSGSDNELAGKDETSVSSTDNVIGGADTRDHIDSFDSSIDQDGNDSRIDLDTLPKDSAEGINTKDAASE